MYGILSTFDTLFSYFLSLEICVKGINELWMQHLDLNIEHSDSHHIRKILSINSAFEAKD